jgi:hypothetical protein
MKFAKAFFMMCLIIIAATPLWAQNGRGFRNGGQNCRPNCPLAQTAVAGQPLNAAETAHLLFLREEEKLALDVYQALSSKWKMRIFSNISAAEQRHFDAIGALIDRYGLADPASTTPGVFANPDLQKLYNNLIARGNRSLPDALEVGVTIEEKDIDDLKAATAETDNEDVLAVYGNLTNASQNHLAAFNGRIEAIHSK